ncbi:unnamed protein product, partial [Ostreobium quekettii]
ARGVSAEGLGPGACGDGGHLIHPSPEGAGCHPAAIAAAIPPPTHHRAAVRPLPGDEALKEERPAQLGKDTGLE